MKNTIADGDVWNYPVPSGTVTAGSVIIMGAVAGIAATDGAAGDTIAVNMCGVYSIAKLTTSGNVFAKGAKVYHNGTTATVVDTDTFIGYAYDAAIQADTTVNVKLLL